MTYSLGIDVGAETTTWSRVTDGVGSEASGTVPSAAGVAADGQLCVAHEGDDSTGVVTAFVGSLGSSDPVMVGGTPYGVEALVATVLADVVATNVAATGSRPDVVALVHDDALDPYRTSLLRESARVGGIAADALMLVTRSAADAAAEGSADGSAAAGAALIGVSSLPDAPERSGGLAAGAAGVAAAGSAGATGAAVLGAEVGEAGIASLSGAAAGPAGAIAGPGGSTVGPAGTSAGPTGSSVGPSGVASGGAAGPGGSGSLPAAGSSIGWVPIAVAGVVALVVVVVGVVVLAGGDDRPAEQATAVVAPTESVVDPATVTDTVDTEPSESIALTSLVENTSVESSSATTLNPDIDLSAFVGEWVVCAPSPDAPNVSAAVEYSFVPAGPNQLTLEYTLLVYTDSSDCSTAGIASNSDSYLATVVGETVIDGVGAVQVSTTEENFVMGVVGDTLRYGTSPSGAGLPTAFDPTQVYSRRG